MFFKEIDETGADVSLIIGSGRSMLGEPRYLKNVANALKKRHITLGMVEADVQLQFIKMDGLVPLSEVMDYDAARVYTIAEDEQRKMKVFDAFRRWSLADDERNIRVNYIRPFVTGLNGNTALETNLEYVSDVTRDVASHGYISGRAGVFAPYHSSRLFYVPMAFLSWPLGAFISFSLASCPNAIMASWSFWAGWSYLLVTLQAATHSCSAR